MRLLIVTDCAPAAEAIRRAMRHVPQCRVLGFVDGRRRCAGDMARADPDVVVFDDMQDREALLARIAEARDSSSRAKLVLLIGAMEARWLDAATRAGIDAAIAKGPTVAVGLLIREVAAGNVYHAFEPIDATDGMVKDVADILTAREIEVLRLVAGGKSNGRIAAELWVTEQTVKFHLSNVYRKLGVRNRTEASHYAHLNGLVELSTRGYVAVGA